MADAAPTAEMTLAWSFYYFNMLVYVATQSLMFVALVRWSLQSLRWRFGERRVEKVRDPIAAVVPCYLPNEAPIIRETIGHLMGQLTGLDDLTVYLVYNTPSAMDIEQELEELARACVSPGRRLVVHRARGSKSKAQNLNEIIPKISAKYVAIYDADHHPDPESLAIAVNHLQDNPELDCVQGSMYIREGGSQAMRTWINSEFFMNYHLVLPMLERVSGSAFFSGSNGVWCTPSIKRTHFDVCAMTEDIDCSVRAVLHHNMRFEFLPQSRSGELAPICLGAFYKQRIRWAMGWDETTLKHGPSCFRSTAASRRSRFAVFYLLIWRYFAQVNSTIMILVQLSMGFLQAVALDGEVIEKPPPCVQRLNSVGLFYFLAFISFSVLQLVLRHPKAHTVLLMVVYFTTIPFYVLWNTSMLGVSLTKVVTGTQGEWTVTARHVRDQDHTPPEDRKAGYSGSSSSQEDSREELRPLVAACRGQTWDDNSDRSPWADAVTRPFTIH